MLNLGFGRSHLVLALASALGVAVSACSAGSDPTGGIGTGATGAGAGTGNGGGIAGGLGVGGSTGEATGCTSDLQSTVDAEGNVVAMTKTINFGFGAGVVPPGTGVLLNNEMDDFSIAPGVPNAFGLVGGEANAVGAAKIPLSSMTPTLVFRDGKLRLVVGSPGGSTIINTVLQIVLNVIDRGMHIGDAIAAPRLHQQWLPVRQHPRGAAHPLRSHAGAVGDDRGRQGAAGDDVGGRQQHRRLAAHQHAWVGHGWLCLPSVGTHDRRADVKQKTRHRPTPS